MSKYREIYLAETMEMAREMMERVDPVGVYSSPDQLQIVVFRRRVCEECAPRLYRPYKYRSGLRFQRFLRIIGRH